MGLDPDDSRTQHWHLGRCVLAHHSRGDAILGTRIYMETDNAHLLCLDARSGDLLWDVLYATGNRNDGATSAPHIVHDTVLVGTSGGDDGVRGAEEGHAFRRSRVRPIGDGDRHGLKSRGRKTATQAR